MKKLLSFSTVILIILFSVFPCSSFEAEDIQPVGDSDAYLVGDANANGEIEIIDVTVISRYIAGFSVSVIDLDAADSDTDGSLSIIDATIIQRYLAEIDAYATYYVGVYNYVVDEGKRVAEKVSQRKNADTVSFIAFSDAHYHADTKEIIDGITHAGQGMDIIISSADIDFAAVLGDNGWQDSSTSLDEGLRQIQATNDLIASGMEKTANLRVPGNHCSQIGAYYTNRDYHRNADLYPYYGAYNTQAVFDEENRRRGYCYQDFSEHKLRVICLNTSDLEDIKPANLESHDISAEQLKWFCSALDMSKKADAAKWQILILSHAPLDWSDNTMPASVILNAYASGSQGSVTKNDTEIRYDFSRSRRAAVIGQVHGHIHDYKVDNLRYIDNDGQTRIGGISRIAVPNACNGRDNEYKYAPHEYLDIDFADEVSYHKTVGTGKDTSFTVFTVDLAARKVYADCYGAGIDRVISY